MILRIILIIAILGIVFWFLRNGSSTRIKAIQKLWVVALSFFAIITLLFPDITTKWANFLGIGRGADLLTYLLAISFLAFALAQYMNSKKQQQQINTLARKLAILETVERSAHKSDT